MFDFHMEAGVKESRILDQMYLYNLTSFEQDLLKQKYLPALLLC